MTVFYTTGSKKPRAKLLPVASPSAGYVGLSNAALEQIRFNQFWDLMDAIRLHGYTRSAMSVIGRSTIGAGWSITKTEDEPDAPDRHRRRLLRFYNTPIRRWDNIKDFYSLVFKIMSGAMYLRYFGQCAYQIVRNKETNEAVGLDFLPGFILPNVDALGKFKSPAFYQYPTRLLTDRVDFENPRDIVFITNPDWEGYPTGGSDLESVANFSLALDIYLQTAAREYMKNRDRPEAIYILPADISDEAFNDFSEALAERYAGPSNIGKSPITVAGDLKIEELSKLPADLPYQEARKDTRQEVLAATGVAGAKLGLTESMTAANLREARREFHESTMIPLFRLIEAALYEQVHIREFGFTGWSFRFGNPDFLTAVERATVHMRYKDMSAMTTNDIRFELGKPARKDDLGDKFTDQIAQESAKAKAEQQKPPEMPMNPQGSPPEGHVPRPDSPANVGEPTLDNQDPPRGDNHNDNTSSARALISELQSWKAFAVRRFNRSMTLRAFRSDVIPEYLAGPIQVKVQTCTSAQDIAALFEDVIGQIEEMMETVDGK